jgi:hypothetical protein
MNGGRRARDDDRISTLPFTPSAMVERCVGRLKQWRRITTRYEKRVANYRAAVVIAALVTRLTA